MWQKWLHSSRLHRTLSQVEAWWQQHQHDPWPDELTEALQSPEAVPVCRNCLVPQTHTGWFCPECGTSVGPYNNLMPFIYIYSIGEAVRSGVGPETRFTPFRTVGYILLGLVEYNFFCPLYFFRLYRNFKRLKSNAQTALSGTGEHLS